MSIDPTMNWYLFTVRITSRHYTPVTETGTVGAEDEFQAHTLVEENVAARYGESAHRVNVTIHPMIKREEPAE